MELLNSGYDVIIADDYGNNCPKVVNQIEQITGKNISAYKIVVKDKVAVRKFFAENKMIVLSILLA